MAKFVIEKPPEGMDPAHQDWVMELQQRIADALSVLEPDELILPEKNVAPTRRVNGRLSYADGVNWDPGTGEGIYLDNATTYTKL